MSELKIKKTGAPLRALFFALYPFCLCAQSLHVADFGALPNDEKCDIDAVAKALEHAKENGAKELHFDAGTYDFNVGDAEKKRAIVLKRFSDFAIVGKLDESGEPATVFLRRYDFKSAMDAKEILYAEGCKNLSLKNLVFDNYPRYMSAGEIVENDGENVIVRVLDGNPYIDKTVIYCANLWDKKTRNLLKVPSVTYGGALSSDVHKRHDEYTMRFYGDPKERLLRLTSKETAGKVAVGQIFSWHFGWLGYQVNFGSCENLRLENITTHSAIGIAINSIFCKSAYANNVKFMRAGNQMQVGCRDAWILNVCSGDYLVENMYVEGVRWDGQNVCGRMAWSYGKTGPKSALLSNGFLGMKPYLLPKGSKVGLCNDRDGELLLTIASAKQAEPNKTNGKPTVEVFFEEELPEWLKDSTTFNIYAGSLDSYELRNCVFKNIAGTASVIRTDNSKISGCIFENIMYPAVCIGADLSAAEGPVVKNALVENCAFKNCGWEKRHHSNGALSVSLEKAKRVPISEMPYIKNVVLRNNTFEDCKTGIEARGALGLKISGSRFKNVETPILEEDCEEVLIRN